MEVLMRKIMLFFSMLVLFQVSSIYAQTMEDYVLEHRGDTLVVKDDFDMNASNALYNLLLADSMDVPAGRVYMLHKNGYYTLMNTPVSSVTRKVIIAGENLGSLKTYKGSVSEPILCGTSWEGGSSTGGLTTGKDLEVKNISMSLGNAAGGIGWNWFGHNSDNCRLTVDNCIMEHTLWVMFNGGTNAKTFIKNCYFVNMTGQSCRRNGGVMDMFQTQDTLLVENCTHVMAQGMIYKPRSYTINRLIYNHNTFINIGNLVFSDLGYQKNASLTNNIFVNANLQAYCGDPNRDPGECDLDPGMPTGLVNVAQLDSTHYNASDIHFYVDRNLVYWDPMFDNLVSSLNADAVSGYTAWTSQNITMNTRTQGYFDANTQFPYLYEGNWTKGKMPAFTEPKDLFTTQLSVIHDYVVAKSNNDAPDIMAEWRLVNTPDADYFTYADFPIPVDLSYSDADLKTAAMGNFPLGDLNWFTAEYKQWLAQRDAEYTNIHNALLTGNPVGVEKVQNVADKFELAQNYPNPFNPSTDISFTLPKAGNVVLKVYNALGEEVATLLNGFKQAQTYHINFNAANLPSGVYVYSVNYDNNSVSKKMVLMK
jgi:hypothetical protein